jgi:glycerate 2-kinase
MRSDLLRIYAAGIAAVAPSRLIGRALTGELDPRIPIAVENAERIRILAVGKASVGMALAARERLGAKVLDTLVVTIAPPPAEVAGDLAASDFSVITGAHPLPDVSSVAAGQAALEFVARTRAGELLLLLLSGGASAMMAVPAPGIVIADKIALSSALMRAGASIGELNTVRKHLSAVKGGGLLRVLDENATMLSLILSDVPDNDLATIGSGPAVADPTTFADAIAVLKRRKLWGRTPEAVRDRFERGAAHEIGETMKRDDRAMQRSVSVVIGDNRTACDGAAEAARSMGYAVEQWRDLSGPAEAVCSSLATHLSEFDHGRICVIAGGEPQVTVRGSGKGGRAQHCALLLATELAQRPSDAVIGALFAGTDGIDGPTDAAGAIVTSSTVRRALEARLDVSATLARNDSYSLFQGLGDLIITGPTGTNVTDIFVGIVLGGGDRPMPRGPGGIAI